ncbi:MAG TPA: HupE/UreJ family protein [Burkholderiales bacterium]|jgi:urease accessory protein|nr:HupE/UreJ family protein [Burkholderiales bacterium]
MRITRSTISPDLFSRSMFALACLFWPALALAHVGQGDISGGFLAGVAHPVFGLDHVVAMVAVGIWGAQLGKPAIWVLPVTFPLVMAFGGVLGGLGVPIPGIEIGIAVSAIVLGGMIAFATRPPLWVAAIVVGIFAIFHGHAHGAELPESANAISYAVGFVAATGSLHALGILIGVANRWNAGAKALRAGGGVIAACGIYFLTGHLIAG